MNMDLAMPLEQIFKQLTPRQKSALKNLGLRTFRDLLYHFPYRYENPADLKRIGEVFEGEKVRIWGRVKKIDFEKTWKKKLNIAYATVEDPTGRIKLVWFRQPYIAKMLPEGSCAIFSGKVAMRGREKYIANPLYDIVPCSVIPAFSREDAAKLQPLYSSTSGISSLWISKAISRILLQIQIPEFLPEEIIKKTSGIKLSSIEALKDEFIKLLPFGLTGAQKRAVEEVLKDLKSGHPMNRLLEGDVGSGKTAVAGCAAYIVAKNGMQATYMAPTEILARQHFETFYKLLAGMGIKIGLLTSSISEKFPSKINPKLPTHISKSQLLKWVREGEIDILIGTHALIEKKVVFSAKGGSAYGGKKLGLAMVDEQHRFGVLQRSRLLKKTEKSPHFLTMTATPIPRTLALTIYADLDVSLIDEMPEGRKPIETKIVPPKERNLAYEFIKGRLAEGDQAFVICPRIEPKNWKSDFPWKSDFLRAEMKSVKEEHKKLKEKIFPEFNIGIMHGKLTPKEKEETMRRFREGKTHVLVSTSVVEVGVDVPNATIMLIEGAERFGLARLHQFRGRVGRSEKKSYCF